MTVIGGPRNFFQQSGITDPTIQHGITQHIYDLRNANIWDKLKAIYPFVGGTATTHKFNLKDPRDTNAAFRLTFSGGWTHSATGALPNGTNGYAETYLNVNNILNSTNHAFNFYLNSDYEGTVVRGIMGAREDGNNILDTYRFAATGYFRSGTAATTISMTNAGKGFFGLTRRNSINFDVIKQDGTFTTSVATPTYTSIDKTIWIGRINPVGVGDYSDQSIAYASISDGLTQDEMLILRTSVINLQTLLGRN